MRTLSYQKDVPLLYDVDVFVAGGGPAGCAAAAAAAKRGATVYLAEAQASFGGCGTNGMVLLFMTFGDGVHFVADGIGREVWERMNGYKYPRQEGVVCGDGIHPECLRRAYDDMMEAYGVQFNFGTTLVDAVVGEDRKIAYCILTGRGGAYAVRAKQYIDATGDGELSALAGAGYEYGDEKGLTMGASLCSLWTDIDYDRRDGWDESRLEQAIADGVFREPDRHLPGMNRISCTAGGGNIGHIFGVDARSMPSVTEALVYGRRLYDDYVKYYNAYLPGFEKAELLTTANMLGIRESRRIDCYYRLCREDYMRRAVFEDEIGRYCYPMDIHESDNSAESNARFKEVYYDDRYRYAPGETYGIPYRSLVVRDVDNLLVAGRCISSTHEAQASYRIMPFCSELGHAAGTAVAVAVKNGTGVRDVDVKQVQEILRSEGIPI